MQHRVGRLLTLRRLLIRLYSNVVAGKVDRLQIALRQLDDRSQTSKETCRDAVGRQIQVDQCE